MKILWLYKYLEEYNFDNWLHTKYVENLAKHPGVEIVCYGPGMHICNPELTPIQYRQDMDIYELCNQLNPDYIICNTKSRMFMHYSPHKKEAEGLWLPIQFPAFNRIPKIMIEEDYHYEIDDSWYKDQGFNLILQRHYGSSLRPHTVPVKWFPFSVDTDIFKPNDDPNHVRIEKICMAGSVNGAYPERQVICDILRRKHLAEIFDRKQMIGDKYIKCLQDYIAHISGCSQYKITPAKMFEIMASGSVMLTNYNEDLKLLFDDNSYVLYRTDLSRSDNIIAELARQIINDKAYRTLIANNALKCIKERHTHFHRNEELKRILEGTTNVRQTY
jgi:hypothetical protein